MFLMCAEQFKTSFSFFNLGVANYHLGFYDEAEKVLAIVNLMDSSNALTWAYLALSLLSK
jgi:tetratricopeptide (TPR) repeat protein